MEVEEEDSHRYQNSPPSAFGGGDCNGGSDGVGDGGGSSGGGDNVSRAAVD